MYSQSNIKELTKLGWKPNTNLEVHLRQTIEAEKN
jgi:dTDP-D-glucose 4,6-dehydratase